MISNSKDRDGEKLAGRVERFLASECFIDYVKAGRPHRTISMGISYKLLFIKAWNGDNHKVNTIS